MKTSFICAILRVAIAFYWTENIYAQGRPPLTTPTVNILSESGNSVLIEGRTLPVRIIQKNGPLWITDTGETIHPLNPSREDPATTSHRNDGLNNTLEPLNTLDSMDAREKQGRRADEQLQLQKDESERQNKEQDRIKAATDYTIWKDIQSSSREAELARWVTTEFKPTAPNAKEALADWSGYTAGVVHPDRFMGIMKPALERIAHMDAEENDNKWLGHGWLKDQDGGIDEKKTRDSWAANKSLLDQKGQNMTPEHRVLLSGLQKDYGWDLRTATEAVGGTADAEKLIAEAKTKGLLKTEKEERDLRAMAGWGPNQTSPGNTLNMSGASPTGIQLSQSNSGPQLLSFDKVSAELGPKLKDVGIKEAQRAVNADVQKLAISQADDLIKTNMDLIKSLRQPDPTTGSIPTGSAEQIKTLMDQIAAAKAVKSAANASMMQQTANSNRYAQDAVKPETQTTDLARRQGENMNDPQVPAATHSIPLALASQRSKEGDLVTVTLPDQTRVTAKVTKQILSIESLIPLEKESISSVSPIGATELVPLDKSMIGDVQLLPAPEAPAAPVDQP